MARLAASLALPGGGAGSSGPLDASPQAPAAHGLGSSRPSGTHTHGLLPPGLLFLVSSSFGAAGRLAQLGATPRTTRRTRNSPPDPAPGLCLSPRLWNVRTPPLELVTFNGAQLGWLFLYYGVTASPGVMGVFHKSGLPSRPFA